MMKLTERLRLVAEKTEPCICVADIGTDHAYLPVWLLQNAKAERAIAADINPKPLQNAQHTLEQYGLADHIELRLSNGLQNFSPDEVQEIVIAGMGGTQISEMIMQTPWLQDPHKHLVLQPMTHFEDVRQALCENGFWIESESTIAEGKRIYLVLSARFSGKEQNYPEWYYYAGKLPQSRAQTDFLFLKKVLARLQKRADALKIADPQESERLQRIIKEIRHECGTDF